MHIILETLFEHNNFLASLSGISAFAYINIKYSFLTLDIVNLILLSFSIFTFEIFFFFFVVGVDSQWRSSSTYQLKFLL